MPETDRTFRLQVILNDDEMRAIFDYQFEKRLQNRSEAIRELLRLGLLAHKALTQDESK